MKYKVIIFNYDEAWMIVLYKNGEQFKYWSSAEDDWDNTWEYIYLLQEAQDLEIISPKFADYDSVINFEKEYNSIFELTDVDIEYLRTIQ